MRIITLFNQKGGVGKTTSCINIGAALSLRGFKCLLIDLDPQGNLSISAGYNRLSEKDLTTYEVLKGIDINRAIRRSENGYDILPTDVRLSAAELELVASKRRNYILKSALGELIRKYDYILIDSPPSLGILSLIALTAATDVLIPVQAQFLPLAGVAQLRDTIELVKSRFNPKLEIAGIIITFYSNRRNLDNDVLEALEQAFGHKVFKTMINTNTKIAEAPSYGKDIIAYSKRSKGAQQYKALVDEIIEHETTEGANDERQADN